MQIYLVGGAVRDGLMKQMGLPVQEAHDRDWVVVGSTPEAMVAQGFTPVGKDFPVFLHPKTHEEYALARTERKNGRGYKGFSIHTSPEVTLEEDLARRDLTLNAMARPLLSEGAATEFGAVLGEVIDPFNGQADLKSRCFRHVTDAFREDPLRILRVARFAARFPDFHVADTTLALMREMVADHELSHLVPERVWQEMLRGLMAERPSRWLEVLNAVGALHPLLPQTTFTPELAQRLDRMASEGNTQSPLEVRSLEVRSSEVRSLEVRSLEVRYAAAQFGDSAAWHVPKACLELAQLIKDESTALAELAAQSQPDAEAWMALLERCDALRKPQRFEKLLEAHACLHRDAGAACAALNAAQIRWRHALVAVLSLETAPLVALAKKQGLKGPEMGQLIRQHRVGRLAHQLR